MRVERVERREGRYIVSGAVLRIKASADIRVEILKLDLGGIWASAGRSSPQICVGQSERRRERYGYEQRRIPTPLVQKNGRSIGGTKAPKGS
jgi:hypothetical protein